MYSLLLIFTLFWLGYENFFADGGIGFGLNQMYNGTKSTSTGRIEDNTDIMQALSSEMESIDSRIFGIYINELGSVFKDYALILGGINYKYSHKRIEEIKYVDVIEGSGHYWNLAVDSMILRIPGYHDSQE